MHVEKMIFKLDSWLRCKLNLPPIREQCAITEILGDWKSAIHKLTSVIQAKQELLKGLAQQLLTGQQRLPDFGATPWREFRLGNLFRERNETNCLDLPLLSIPADRGVIRRQEISRKDSSSEDKTRYKRIAPGDIGYNTMRMWQGASALSSLAARGEIPSFWGST